MLNFFISIFCLSIVGANKICGTQTNTPAIAYGKIKSLGGEAECKNKLKREAGLRYLSNI